MDIKATLRVWAQSRGASASPRRTVADAEWKLGHRRDPHSPSTAPATPKPSGWQDARAQGRSARPGRPEPRAAAAPLPRAAASFCALRGRRRRSLRRGNPASPLPALRSPPRWPPRPPASPACPPPSCRRPVRNRFRRASGSQRGPRGKARPGAPGREGGRRSCAAAPGRGISSTRPPRAAPCSSGILGGILGPASTPHHAVS